MKNLKKKIFLFGSWMLILTGTQLCFVLESARSSIFKDHEQYVFTINAPDAVYYTDTEDSDDDDDEWEA